MAESPKKISDLIPDRKNRRKHTSRNIEMLQESLEKVGTGRSIVIDENNEVLAGNATIKAAANIGLSKVRVIEVDGTEVVAVRRTGLSDQQKRELALYDNRVAEFAEWDVEQLAEDIDAGLDLGSFFHGDEVDNILGKIPEEGDWLAAMDGLTKESDGFQRMSFILTDEQVETVKRALLAVPTIEGEATGNLNKNGNALSFVCASYVG